MNERELEVCRIVLRAVHHCSACGRDYLEEAVSVVGQRGDLWLLTLHCPSCWRRGYVAALLNSEVEPLPTPAPALTPAAVDQADVEAMRRFLVGFDGDLAAYLAGR
jgi:hypothetical protein